MKYFRKTSLEKIYLIEGLDQRVIITRFKNWIFLLVILLILIGFTIWGILGKVYIEVSGPGVLIRDGGIYSVLSPGTGVISGVNKLNDGQFIKAGEMIGQIQQPLIQNRVKALQEYLDELVTYKHRLDLSAVGSVSVDLKILNVDHQLKIYNREEPLFSKVITSYSGNIIRINSSDGDYVIKGQSILYIEDTDKKLEARIYISKPSDVNQIKLGMKAKIFIGNSPYEKFGYMKGRVKSISQFPVDKSNVGESNGNALLKLPFLKKYSYIVRVELFTNPKNPNSYQFSNSKNQNTFNLKSGTICSARIIIKKISPLRLIWDN